MDTHHRTHHNLPLSSSSLYFTDRGPTTESPDRSINCAIGALKNDGCSTVFDSRFLLGIIQERPSFVSVHQSELSVDHHRVAKRERKGTVLQILKFLLRPKNNAALTPNYI
ncbi:hypothetical protein BS17DRAFT_779102 [Gyrodon lividus]|nr:hypothetical protein BS17DRAFT_779102 [Gyrodon lividus]